MDIGKVAMENERYTYGCIAVDVTSNCNLRCRFCVNNWAEIKGNTNMTEETFDKVVQLLPLSADERFFISCRYEPLIHPNLIGLLKKIPKEMKHKTFFTTNLAKKLTVEYIEELSKANLSFIQISLDTFNPDLFEDFRVGAKYKVFINNLENIAKIFEQNPDSPHLRYITMVFKQNIDEVPSLVEKCHEKYLSTQNEFRTPFAYSLAFNDVEWLKKSIVSKEEWNVMVEKISKLPYPINLFNPPNHSNEEWKSTGNLNLDFTITSDGTVMFHDRKSEKLPLEFRQAFNINTVSKPYNYFKNILYKIREG